MCLFWHPIQSPFSAVCSIYCDALPFGRPVRMNCFLETLASMWLISRRSLGLRPPVCEDETIQENLESCRQSLEAREAELVEGCRRLARDALRKRQQGDVVGARTKLLERRRAVKRLEKLRNNLGLVGAQIDALQSTELDKELMQALLASSDALKRAGVGKGIKEAEEVMSQLDEQMREASELTSVLAAPVQEDEDLDVEEEFELLRQEGEIAPGFGAGSFVGMSVAGKESVMGPNAMHGSVKEAVQPLDEAPVRGDGLAVAQS
jgi:hypothetical protein